MNIQTIEEVPFSNRFDKEIAYIYSADIWWDGAGADASIFWEDINGKCHYLAIETGETTEPIEPKFDKEITIKRKLFLELSQNLIEAGITEIKSQFFPASSLHRDLFFSMKLKNGETATYIVKGGITKDSKINKVEKIIVDFIHSLRQYK
jgi:hypothetical protein